MEKAEDARTASGFRLSNDELLSALDEAHWQAIEDELWREGWFDGYISAEEILP